jgi:hypothetical protein
VPKPAKPYVPYPDIMRAKLNAPNWRGFCTQQLTCRNTLEGIDKMRARIRLEDSPPEGKANSRSSSQPTPSNPAPRDMDALIRRRASQLYMQRGTGTQDELRDWYQAEAEIRAHLSDSGLEDAWADDAPAKRSTAPLRS